ncbi:MAG: LicD family protein [Eubacteriaceae bacterium]|jgi:lipopolysaccharide cholinephosphotransferase|nr:LicD family protein [Eubacteriaceae bacterium]
MQILTDACANTDSTKQIAERNIAESSPEEIRSVQEKALEILKYFDSFCTENSLSYFLCGGALIGAVREGGFVPWDDDIDVFMLREDYEALAQLWPAYADTGKFSLCRSGKESNFRHADTSIVHVNTTFVNLHSQDMDIPHGIALDVIPLDGLAPSAVGRVAQKFWALAYCLFNAQRLPDHQGKFVRAISRIALSLLPSKRLRYAVWSFAEKKMSRYPAKSACELTELVTGLKYLGLRYSREMFAKHEYVEFEGFPARAPSGYRKYLELAFGNYMALPPENERKPKHQTAYFNAYEPYEAYQGIYYCKTGD